MFTPKTIHQIAFSLFSPDDIRKMSVVEISTADTYDEEGYPIEKGLMDPQLGVIDPGIRCRTCGGRFGECLGHFGHIPLARPTVHTGYAKLIYNLLRSICQSCFRILIVIFNFFHRYN